ncbi:MAG: ATP-dependent Clp protease proteolytic subunit [Thermoplasmatales archaeon]
MASQHKKDILEIFHDYGVYLPTRTIMLDSTYDESGHSDGVNHYMATKFLKNFMHLYHLNKDPITVILNTQGGSCVEGYVIYDVIRAAKNCHVTVKVVGQASSMGCIILQAGDERILTPNCSIMFHAGTGGVGDYNPYEVENSAMYDKKFMERMYKILLERINEKREKDNKTEMSWKMFENMNLKGKYLFPEEAIEIGLADKIEE